MFSLVTNPMESLAAKTHCIVTNPGKMELTKSKHILYFSNLNDLNFRARRKLILASVLCLVFMICEVVGGVLSNSLAIATDAAHLLTGMIRQIQFVDYAVLVLLTAQVDRFNMSRMLELKSCLEIVDGIKKSLT